MSRAIRLTHIHAINWYGYSDSIPIEGDMLLGGVTGSGKSILMDLIQLVLLGDERFTRFNQSATGSKSKRSVKGYCLGDTKLEENGVPQYMRTASVSYIALEFTWPQQERTETWGLRIEFTSAAEQHGTTTPFFVPAQLLRSDFLDSERPPRALEFVPFKALVESRICPKASSHGRVYSRLEDYLRDMMQPPHLNFDRGVLQTLLPTAMSFTFLQNFDEFCREYILPSGRVDISDVTTSYRTFQAYERDLKSIEAEFERLKGIQTLATEYDGFRRDRRLARYLEMELRFRYASGEFAEKRAELSKLEAECKVESERLRDLATLIPNRRSTLDGIKALINETEAGRLYSLLKRTQESLTSRIGELERTSHLVTKELELRVGQARELARRFRALPLDGDERLLHGLDEAIAAVGREENSPTESLRSLDAKLKQLRAAYGVALKPIGDRYSDIKARIGTLTTEIAALEVGKLPFPTRLLDALNNALPTRSRELRALPLSKLCELNDERWRVAAEVAFTQKFAIVVAAEDYATAEQIYHEMKEDSPRESLVNPHVALGMGQSPIQGSLAARLDTAHPVARAIISHLFGKMVCVERREDLSAHAFAVTRDGFVKRGPFVERPQHYDNLPYVGQRGLAQQLKLKQDELKELQEEELRLRPIVMSARALFQDLDNWPELPHSLVENIVRLQELPKLQSEWRENESSLEAIDQSKFEELASQKKLLEDEIKDLEGEKETLDRSERRVRVRTLTGDVNKMEEAAATAQAAFEKVRFDPEISKYLGRMEELRVSILQKFPGLNIAAEQFKELYNDYNANAVETKQKLFAARRELRNEHKKYSDDEFNAETEDNAAYDKALARIDGNDIPLYRQKAERERRTWEHLFRTQVLEKLRAALAAMEEIRKLLNQQLKQPIGNDRYRIEKKKNDNFKIYHRMLEASALAREDELFFASADADLKMEMEKFVEMLTSSSTNAETAKLLDYRRYYIYDMEVDDITQPESPPASLNKQSGKFSGGENQSPYFVAILASYLRAYKRHDSRGREPSLALVPIDEAFSKLSGSRIEDCITALRSLGLQGILSMATGNIPPALKLCDGLVAISKEIRRVGKSTKIRNIAISMARDSDEAQRFVEELQ